MNARQVILLLSLSFVLVVAVNIAVASNQALTSQQQLTANMDELKTYLVAIYDYSHVVNPQSQLAVYVKELGLAYLNHEGGRGEFQRGDSEVLMGNMEWWLGLSTSQLLHKAVEVDTQSTQAKCAELEIVGCKVWQYQHETSDVALYFDTSSKQLIALYKTKVGQPELTLLFTRHNDQQLKGAR